MKNLLLILFVSTVLISCSESNPDANHSPPVNQHTFVKETTFASWCFYKLDNKYSTENDSATIVKWLKEKSDQIINNTATNNIFNHNGGGPNGAEWNPSTDLYIAVQLPSPPEDLNENLSVLVNGKPYQQLFFEYDHGIFWYRIDQTFWENEIKTIDSTDIDKIYSPLYLKGINDGDFQPITELNYGEVLKFEIIYDTDTLVNFFHATYGE